jgi:hypothetical protein
MIESKLRLAPGCAGWGACVALDYGPKARPQKQRLVSLPKAGRVPAALVDKLVGKPSVSE